MTWKTKILRKPKKQLFHYTTIDGLIGIFKSKKIWATSAFHLNDKAELSLAARIFNEAIDEVTKKMGFPPELALHPADYKEDVRKTFLRSLFGLSGEARRQNIFLCSFSEAENQLSQWRAYCPGGYGFCIGFDYPQLEKQIERQKFILAKCIYKKDEQRQIVNRYVMEAIEPRLDGLNDKNLITRMVASVVELFSILPILKDISFSEEREWRLISVLQPDDRRVEFRAGRATLIPYYEFELTDEKNKTLPIKSIIVGPTPNEDESLQAVKTFLAQEGMSEQVAVISSKIPYREV
jgi:hypothetical protein